MDKVAFEELTIQAMDNLSKEFQERLHNVTVIIEDTPEENSKRANLLGLYEGIPNPYKGVNYTFVLPDKITLFMLNILHWADYQNKPLIKIIEEVLYHEIGHHFGFSEEDLQNLDS
jgi:predicted Zn-dependent protease with MMP-like domain